MTRSVRMIFAASLLFNVFAAGALGGGLLMLARPAVWRSITGTAGRPIQAAGDALPQPDRQKFRRTLTRVMQDNRDLMREAADDRASAAALFVQPQFDQEAVAAALERARNADFQLRTRLEKAAVDFAATLPANEREVLAQALERRGTLRHSAQANAAK